MKKLMTRIYLYVCLFFYMAQSSNAHTTRILFIGNSFTHMHNFTTMVSELASFSNDTIITEQSAFDSHTLEKHSTTEETLQKIALNCWDYVVLQEQSQRPAMDETTFKEKTLFFANKLDSIIHFHNPNAQTLLFMTWGRKFGDRELYKKFPYCSSYSGMQDKLAERYWLLGSKLAAAVIPCGIAWKYFQEEHYINLFDEDFKHPNIVGSYLNACMFYSFLTKKTPEGILYNPAGLEKEDLLVLQRKAFQIVKLYFPTFFNINIKQSN